MAAQSGLASQWCAVDDTAYGVAPSLSTAKFSACDSDTLALKKVPKQSTGIFAGSQFPRSQRRVGQMQYSAGGNLVMDLPERGMQQWLFRMFGSYGQAASVLTQDATTGAYKSVHAPGFIDGHSFTVQKGAPTVDNGTIVPFTYPGCKVQSWELSAAMDGIVKLTMTIEARNELEGSWKDPLNGSVPSLQSYTAPLGNVFRWVGATVFTGGTPSTTSGVTTLASPVVAGNVKGPLSIKWTRALDLARYAPDVAPFRNEPVQDGLSQVTGSLVTEWLSTDSYRSAFQNDTGTAVEYQFQTVGIGSGSDVATFAIMCPNIRYNDAAVPIPGPTVLTETIPWEMFDDGVNNAVQATYVTLDSA